MSGLTVDVAPRAAVQYSDDSKKCESFYLEEIEFRRIDEAIARPFFAGYAIFFRAGEDKPIGRISMDSLRTEVVRLEIHDFNPKHKDVYEKVIYGGLFAIHEFIQWGYAEAGVIQVPNPKKGEGIYETVNQNDLEKMLTAHGYLAAAPFSTLAGKVDSIDFE